MVNLQYAFQTARKAQESLYDAVCTIKGVVDYTKPNGATGQREETYITDQPCRVSKKSLNTADQGEEANSIDYIPELFLSPDYEIRPGSTITVTQIINGRVITTDYEQSGVPAVYQTHQEIMMKAKQKRA